MFNGPVNQHFYHCNLESSFLPRTDDNWLCNYVLPDDQAELLCDLKRGWGNDDLSRFCPLTWHFVEEGKLCGMDAGPGKAEAQERLE